MAGLGFLLVSTSIGAVNASYLAVHVFTVSGLAGLEDAWREAAATNLMPANYHKETKSKRRDTPSSAQKRSRILKRVGTLCAQERGVK